MTELSHDKLKEMLRYAPKTGLFYWLIKPRRCRKDGTAGSIQPHGYLTIGLLGEDYYAHRLAWFYMTGAWPAGQIDHHDLNKSNNAWSNLREADYALNVANRPLRPDNTSGFKGVHRNGRNWRARIKLNGKTVCLGHFKTPELAHTAYCAAAVDSFGDFARTT